MKYVFLVGDGMGDYPVPALGHKTPLQAAHMPNIRRIAAAGQITMVQTVVPELPPGSDVANLSLLGYNPSLNYTGRAPIEAAGAGIPLAPDEVAFRCNLVTVRDGIMQDYSAGHISTEEAHELMAAIEAKLGRPGLKFHGGVSYRHLLVWQNGPADAVTTPPHEFSDKPVDLHRAQGPGHVEIMELIEASKDILANHPVNEARRRAGKHPATQIWLWGQGRALTLDSYQEKFGLTGIIVSAVDLVRGLGVLAGLEAPRIPGATGFLDTNCEGKVEAALKSLEEHPFAYVHLEAPDECGHLGDPHKKKLGIELFDARIVAPIWQALEKRGEPYRLIVAMDHRTPVSLKGHSREPVPIVVLDGPVGAVTAQADFDENCNGGEAQMMVYDWVARALGRP
jgi:2,3-bisphosphoglycerate-independent phosphoglycerate mutase